MDEELKQRLTKYLELMEQAVKDGSDFVVEQTPLYVQEIVAWHMWRALFGAVMWLIPALLVLYLGRMVWMLSAAERAKPHQERSRNEDEHIMATAAFSSFALVVFVILLMPMISNLADAAKAKVAPRVVVIESLQKALK